MSRDQRTALILGYVWPEPRSSAAGVRTWQLIECLRAGGWNVRFAAPCKDNEHRAALERAGIPTQAIAANDPEFDAWIGELRPELAIFDRFVMEEQFGWRVREFSPATVRVLDTQDLHFLRRARDAEARGKAADEGDRWRELAAIHRSDLALVISRHEQELLREQYDVPTERVHYFPFAVREAGGEDAPWSARRGFASLGNFRHPPNLDGVFWLHAEIWPRIRARLPGAELAVYGAYPPKEAMALDDAATGFGVHGWVEDAVATLRQHRVNLAALRFGAGLKGKIVDGWQAGTPCVATAFGAEGMTDGAEWGGLVADSPDEFAAAAVRLHEERAAWEAAAHRGRALLRELFDFDRHGRDLLARIEAVLQDVTAVRAANVVGAMLWHHTLTSTKYMSRWIELKNRLTST
jgi:hypothetical protein